MTLRTARASFFAALSILLSGCGGGLTAAGQRNFDLGINAPGARLPAARIASVRAVTPFESTDMQYRLAYRNAAEIAAFANSRWAAAPAELLRKQLLRAASEKPGKCALDVEIQEFTQVFSARDASEARIELRAWLGAAAGRNGSVATRGWSVVEPNAGADAVSGAAAFARAADRAIGELGAWIAAQPDCR
jgi:cholesterol transport system auxiliary component